jgi:virginiamycin B lyase
MSKSLITVAAVGLVALALVFLLEAEAPAVEATASADAAGEGDSFVYLFDSASETFVFTFPVPSADANPKDVVVVPGAGYEDVWFTEPGAGRIGRLRYADATDYTFQDDYPLLTGSRPLNLVSGGGFIWFTDPGRDSIGRLDPATGQVDEFEAPAGGYPADLDYASDGSIWFTEMMRDRIARLTITSTSDYVVDEYYTAALSGGRPYGLVVAGPSTVYFAQTENDRVTRFSLPNNWLQLYDLTGSTDAPNGPYRLALENIDEVWTTERVGNRLTKFKPGTSPMPLPNELAPTHSLPTGIAVDRDADYVWFTQWSAGQIGNFRSDTGLQYYLLPSPDLTPTGIAVNETGDAWVLASKPYGIYLPFVTRSGG